MQKSKWVSFCGWACVAGVLLHVGGISVDYHYRPGPYPVPQAFLAFVLLGMFPAFGLWVVGTIRHRVRMATAKVNAGAMVEAFGKIGERFPKGDPKNWLPRQMPAGVNLCGVCNREPATVRCIAHVVLLCDGCWQIHERTVHATGTGATAATGR